MVFLEHKRLAHLVEQARNGDMNAFQKIYEHTSEVQYCHIRQIVKNPADAQDALQDTYLLLFRNLDKIDPPTALVAYLNRLSYYVSKNISKSRGRFHRRTVDIEEIRDLSDDQTTPQERIEQEETSGTILHALEELPELERVILSLHYYQKQTLQEIAWSMSLSLSTIKRSHRQAKAHLKEALQKKGILGWAAIMPAYIRTVNSHVSESLHLPLPDPARTAPSVTPPDSVSAPTGHGIAVHTARMISLKGTAAAACLTGAVALTAGAVHAPQISGIVLPEEYVAAPARVEIHVDSSLPVKEIVIMSSEGRKITAQAADGRYYADLTENGNYSVAVKNTAGRKDTRGFSVSQIDNTTPKASSIEHEDGKTIITFEDSESGMKYDSIYCESADGTVTLPETVQEKDGRTVFRLLKKDHVLYFSDRAGNVGYVNLKYEKEL